VATEGLHGGERRFPILFHYSADQDTHKIGLLKMLVYANIELATREKVRYLP
jgi:hypothetical protein